MKNACKIAGSELDVMQSIWSQREPVASSDIVKDLKQKKGWKETTIYTLLSRLVEKGYLVQEKKRHISHYRPTIAAQEYALEQTQGLIDRMFGGDAKQLVSMLYQNKKIQYDELETLKNDWEEKHNGK